MRIAAWRLFVSEPSWRLRKQPAAGYAGSRKTTPRRKSIMSQRIPQKPKRRRPDFRQDPCQDVFTCRVCGWPVGPQAAGTQHRNHCPNCLSSVHLDDEPGDRAADCGGTMEPVAVWVRKGGEWAIIHRCKVCGVLHSNRVAADDDPTVLMSLAVKPLAMPPFPLERLKRAAE
ncbi:MAG TPA: RNHCP domain-containing protein [Candidatus Oscillibacter excrementigallinarum]|uniref:RNHCP domain-containing protein n=1 Tax=Candidatus Oscillibacter excrementigallinarum TaxID=2838716 RepID=A0A9D2LHV5_9FIRM|nr:RNHCP domain-containing protein [Candidatus Oscillibacter excrementigallinarum]